MECGSNCRFRGLDSEGFADGLWASFSNICLFNCFQTEKSFLKQPKVFLRYGLVTVLHFLVCVVIDLVCQFSDIFGINNVVGYLRLQTALF